MATPAEQLDQLLATTFERVKPVLSDNITKNIALLAALDSKSRVTGDGGVTIRRPLMYALNNTVKSYSGFDRFDTTPQGGFGYAEYNWRQVAGTVTISGEEVRKNAGPAQIIALLAAKLDQLRLSLEATLNQMLWGDGTGNGGKDILGLRAIVDNTGVLGGIDSSTETWWRSVVVTGNDTNPGMDLTTTAGIKKLNNVYNSLAVNRSKVDFEFTTQANFEAYEALATEKVRFVNLKMADLGFEAVAHKTAEVIFDPDVPAPSGSGGGYWYLLNSERLEFVQHNQAWMTNLGFVRPADQDAKTAPIICMGQLITDARRAHAVIKHVKVA